MSTLSNLGGGANEALVNSLVDGWLSHFQKADAQLEWLAAEQEFSIPLADDVILVGRMDAMCRRSDGETAFCEWKTQAPPPKYKAADWKQEWRMNPQSLTYGVAADILWPGTRRFTVRKAFKSSPPTFDFEWFKYSTEEIAWWRGQLLRIAYEIKLRRCGSPIPWPTNLTACFRWGVKYVCPYFYPSCNTLSWGPNPTMHNEDNESELRAKARVAYPDAIILSPTSIEFFMTCPEKYRRRYELGECDAPSQAILDGKDFHALLGRHYGQQRR